MDLHRLQAEVTNTSDLAIMARVAAPLLLAAAAHLVPQSSAGPTVAATGNVCESILAPISNWRAPRYNYSAGEHSSIFRKPLIFNLGAIKMATTSFHLALTAAGVKSCKWRPRPYEFRLEDVKEFIEKPHRLSSALYQYIASCDALSDNPWWMLYPTLMRRFPNARFVLTTRDSDATCTRWLESVKGEWLKHNASFPPGYDAFHRCVFGGADPFSPAGAAGFLKRCQQHTADITKHAASLGVRVIILPLEWSDSAKWAAVADLIGHKGNTSRLVRPFPRSNQARWLTHRKKPTRPGN